MLTCILSSSSAVSFLGLGTDAAIATSIPSRQLFSCDDFQLQALH
jgi:hypothetical protein